MKDKVDVCIDLDNKKLKKKKLSPKESLNNIRNQLNLSDDIFFVGEDDYPIDIDEEEERTLKEILIVKGKSFSLSLKTINKSLISYNVYLNDKIIYSGKFSNDTKLKDSIKDFENLLPKDAILFSNGYQVDISDYEDGTLIDILDNNNLYYKSEEYKVKNNQKNSNFNHKENEDIKKVYFKKSKENSFENDKNEETEEKVFIKIGNETKIKKLKLSTKLIDLREDLKRELEFRFKFLEKGIALEENEENKWTINDILIKENDSKIIYIENCEVDNKIIMENKVKTIKIYDNNKLIMKKKLDINQTLEQIRENICEDIKKEFKFLKKKIEIEEDEESEYLLKDIIKDDAAKIKIVDNNEKKGGEGKSTFIKFKLNGKELFANRINYNLSLFELRRNFAAYIPENARFLKDGYNVTDERGTIIEDILKENEFIYLRTEEEDKKNAPPPAEINEKMKKYKIYLNGKFLQYLKFKEKTTLDEIRILLSKSISEKEQFFSMENEEIPIDNEDQWPLKEYCNNKNKIIIKTIKMTPEPESENQEKKLNEPINGSKKIEFENNLIIYKYPNIPFNENEKIGAKTIMVVGETGSGKTTLLNSFLNYLMGIKYSDSFRYKIIVEDTKNIKAGGSVTANVNVYYIRTVLPKIPYIRIVDTPGFGDTRGIDYDKKIIDMIRETFTKDCDTINAICFVAKSNETRLTDFQKYIFGQVMALFGNDVGENFIAMLTFSDGQIPNIVSCLESKDSIFCQVKEQIQDPWYLTFNNSAVFCGVEQKFSKTFWDIGMDSYRSFVGKLKMLPDKSLVLSRKVLDLRKQLETTIIGLRPQIDKSLIIMENMRKEIAYVRANKDKIDQFKDFEYKYKEPKVTKKNLSQGEYTSNCLICNFTCHYPCYISDNNKKMGCSAMRNEFCTVCKNKCKWDNHKNLNFIFVYEEIEKIKTSEDLRQKFVESTSNLKQSEQILKGLEQEFIDILKECYQNAAEINKCVEQLKKNSLCKNPNEIFEEYIKNCILKEENEKKPGYLDRVKGYRMLKDTNDKIIKAFKGQSIFEDLDKFKEYILKEKEEILKMYEKEKDKDKKSNCMII